MVRQKRLRLSETELETVKSVKQLRYGDDPVPLGLVVREACERVVNDSEEPQKVSF